MGFDIFTLRTLAAELSAELVGRRIGQAGEGDGVLALSCQRRSHLLATLGPQGFLALVDKPLPAQCSGQDGAVPYIQGAHVESVKAQLRDRIITVRLSRRDRQGQATYGQLVFELIRPHVQIVLLSERTGEVLGRWTAARRPGNRVVLGKVYKGPPPRPRLVPGEDGLDAFYPALIDEEDLLSKRLVQVLAGVDKVLAAELVHRSSLEADLHVGSLTPAEAARLWLQAEPFYVGAEGEGGFCWTQDGRPQFAAFEPTNRLGNCQKTQRLSQAIIQAEESAPSAVRDSKIQLQKGLARLVKNCRKKEQALARDLEEAAEADELEKKGSILLAQLALVQPGQSQVELPDIFDHSGQGRVHIDLDPTRAPAAVAEGLLKRAQKYRRRLGVLPARLEAVRHRGEQAARYVKLLRQGTQEDVQGMEKWLQQEQRGHDIRQTGKARQQGPQAHPRRYLTSNGWSVWAGRNNKENDILTHKMAAQNDWWFHAHGYPGSHVVLRRQGRREEPSGRTLEEAASLAAYWSKGRTANKVPVVYTQVKYVTKPRGGAPGLATLKREKTIMVRPQLLEIEDCKDI
ncbi:MAG: DUF814 domain-containing protein [Candidatus Latescibacteria bacterium]|nr:DUF814 domain-containing protein [Candidatus Latescibacterota bacterium]